MLPCLAWAWEDRLGQVAQPERAGGPEARATPLRCAVRLCVLLLSPLCGLVTGCSPASPQPTTSDAAPVGTEPGGAGAIVSIDAVELEACAAVATLYPAERLAGSATRAAVVGKHWARRDGGRGSMHGPPKLWRRNDDLRLEPSEHGVALTYEVLVESTNEEAQTTKLAKDCHLCGEVLVCDQHVWVVSTGTNDPPDGRPLEWLVLDTIAELGDHDLYLVRHGHEIHLDFGADPRTTARGPLEIRVRKLEKGAPVTTQSTTYVAEPMGGLGGYNSVRLDLPGTDGIRLDFRPDRGPDGGGFGTDPTFESPLYEMESLTRNPQLMDQPASLELPADAPGFNLPH